MYPHRSKYPQNTKAKKIIKKQVQSLAISKPPRPTKNSSLHSIYRDA